MISNRTNEKRSVSFQTEYRNEVDNWITSDLNAQIRFQLETIGQFCFVCIDKIDNTHLPTHADEQQKWGSGCGNFVDRTNRGGMKLWESLENYRIGCMCIGPFGIPSFGPYKKCEFLCRNWNMSFRLKWDVSLTWITLNSFSISFSWFSSPLTFYTHSPRGKLFFFRRIGLCNRLNIVLRDIVYYTMKFYITSISFNVFDGFSNGICVFEAM